MTGLVLAAVDLADPEHHTPILTRAAFMTATEQASLAVVTVIPDFGMSIVGSFFEADAGQKALKAAGADCHGCAPASLARQGVRRSRTSLCQRSEATPYAAHSWRPFGEIGCAVQLEICSGAEVSLLIEMVADGGMNSGEFLQTSHAPEPLHGPFSSSKRQV